MKLLRSFPLLLLLIAVASLIAVARAQDDGDQTPAPKDDTGDNTDSPTPVPDETDAPAPVPPNDTTDAPTPADQETEQPTPPAPETLDVVLQGESDLTTLLDAVEAAGLQGVLNDTNVEYTVFAPVNSAFEVLPEDLVNNLLSTPWIMHLQNLLAFHVTDGVLSVQDLEDDEIQMSNRETVTAQSSGNPDNGTSVITLSSDFTPAEVSVISDELTAANGVAYKINSVLLPDWTGIDALTYTSENNDFSTLFDLVNATGFTIPAGSTLLAPTNEAFNELFNTMSNEEFESLTNNTEEVTSLLGGHVFNQVYPSVSLTDGMTLTSLAGTTVTVMLVQQGQNTRVMFNDARVRAADILVNDGIIHSIDTVLQPTTLSPSSTAVPAVTEAPAAAPTTKAPSSGGGDGEPTAPTPPTVPSSPTVPSPPTAELTLVPTTTPADSSARSFLYTRMSGLLLSCAAMFVLV
jgi:uncharacterized surface protein with fasciclin (FAS1) repeats